jgi:hypothetical protein
MTIPSGLMFVRVRRCSARAGRATRTCVMNTQELARELGHPDAQKLLSGSMARLAYNGHDGFPRVIRVGFYRTGERIVVSTAPISPKARALSSRPEVALTIDTDSTPEEAKALLVRGLTTLETVDGVTDDYLAAARRSMDESELAEFERDVRSTYKRWCAFRSSRSGRGSMNLAPAGCRLSWRTSSTTVSHRVCHSRLMYSGHLLVIANWMTAGASTGLVPATTSMRVATGRATPRTTSPSASAR